jgi:hypothetical protein
VLDADCVEKAVTCPCDFTLNAWSQLGIETDITCFIGGTIAAPEDSFMGTQNSMGTYVTGFFTRGDFYCGILIDSEDGPRYHQTQADEAAACRDAIIEVANALDPAVICSFTNTGERE